MAPAKAKKNVKYKDFYDFDTVCQQAFAYLAFSPSPPLSISINFPNVAHKLTRNGHLSSAKANFHLMMPRGWKSFIGLRIKNL